MWKNPETLSNWCCSLSEEGWIEQIILFVCTVGGLAACTVGGLAIAGQTGGFVGLVVGAGLSFAIAGFKKISLFVCTVGGLAIAGPTGGFVGLAVGAGLLFAIAGFKKVISSFL